MDKKKLLRSLGSDDLKGFEEFIQHVEDGPEKEKNPKNLGGENLTFVLNDNLRLKKVSLLMAKKLPVSASHDQGPKIIEHQRNLNTQYKNELFKILSQKDSPLHKSIHEIWSKFFYPKD